MKTLTEYEMEEINGGMPVDPPTIQQLGESLINWAERWYWELTH